MSKRLVLDVDVVETVTQSLPEPDTAASVLRAHGGDAVAAIRELLLDGDHLRAQLYIASFFDEQRSRSRLAASVRARLR